MASKDIIFIPTKRKKNKNVYGLDRLTAVITAFAVSVLSFIANIQNNRVKKGRTEEELRNILASSCLAYNGIYYMLFYLISFKEKKYCSADRAHAENKKKV